MILDQLINQLLRFFAIGDFGQILFRFARYARRHHVKRAGHVLHDFERRFGGWSGFPVEFIFGDKINVVADVLVGPVELASDYVNRCHIKLQLCGYRADFNLAQRRKDAERTNEM